MKQFLKSFAFTVAIGSAGSVFAHGGDSKNPSADDLVEAKTFGVADKTKTKKSLHVVIRKDGHLIGKPFIIEIRADCRGSGASWRKLEVGDMESACGVRRETLKYDPDNASVQIEYFDTDADAFNEESLHARDPVSPRCETKTKTFQVKFSELCG